MRLAAALVFLLAVALASESVAQTAAAPRQALEAMFAPGAGQPIINGGVLATQEGRVVFRAALGFADAQAQRRLRENSVFQTASWSRLR